MARWKFSLPPVSKEMSPLAQSASRFSDCGASLFSTSSYNARASLVLPSLRSIRASSLRADHRRGGWRRLGCASQIFARFIHAWRRRVKGQLGQGNRCLRQARIFGKITNELLQRCFRFFVAFRRLHQSFLQSQSGASLFIASLLLQLAVINQETGLVAKVQPATGGIKERNSRPRQIGMRDLFKS